MPRKSGRMLKAAISLSTASVFGEWFIEQNSGPHLEQNAASLKPIAVGSLPHKILASKSLNGQRLDGRKRRRPCS